MERDTIILGVLGGIALLGLVALDGHIMPAEPRPLPPQRRPAPRRRTWKGYYWPVETLADGRQAAISDGWHLRRRARCTRAST